MHIDPKRLLPILLTVVTLSTGLIVLLSFVIDNAILGAFRGVLVEWTVIIAAFAILLGVMNVLRVHAQRIGKRQGTLYSVILILAFFAVFLPGIIPASSAPAEVSKYVGPQGTIVTFIFQYVQRPLQATMFALMAFFIATAAWRAFRVRSAASLVMLISAVLVLLGSIYVNIGKGWESLVEIKNWILTVPVMAGARGILLGIVLGIIVTSLRFLLGMEHPYSD